VGILVGVFKRGVQWRFVGDFYGDLYGDFV